MNHDEFLTIKIELWQNIMHRDVAANRFVSEPGQ